MTTSFFRNIVWGKEPLINSWFDVPIAQRCIFILFESVSVVFKGVFSLWVSLMKMLLKTNCSPSISFFFYVKVLKIYKVQKERSTVPVLVYLFWVIPSTKSSSNFTVEEVICHVSNISWWYFLNNRLNIGTDKSPEQPDHCSTHIRLFGFWKWWWI